MFEGNDILLRKMIGTPAFFAPEACGGGEFWGKNADIWACGITLYSFIFGRVPFFGKNLWEIFEKISNQRLVTNTIEII